MMINWRHLRKGVNSISKNFKTVKIKLHLKNDSSLELQVHTSDVLNTLWKLEEKITGDITKIILLNKDKVLYTQDISFKEKLPTSDPLWTIKITDNSQREIIAELLALSIAFHLYESSST